MELKLNYEAEPFSIAASQIDLWKVMHLRYLQRVSTLLPPEACEQIKRERIVLEATSKVGPFVTWRLTKASDHVRVGPFGLILENPFLRYSLRVRTQGTLSDFAVYHGTNRAELCMSDKFQPLKYCGDFNCLEFAVSGYRHLYFVTSGPTEKLTLELTITKGASADYKERRYCLKTREQTVEVCRAMRKSSDFQFVCPEATEKMYSYYAAALRAELLPFPYSHMLSFVNMKPLAIRFERQVGYVGSYCFASVTDDLLRRGYILLDHGKKLELRYNTVHFTKAGVNLSDWILRAYGTNHRCIGTWSCARGNVEAVFEHTEYVRFVIENEVETSDPGDVELKQCQLKLF